MSTLLCSGWYTVITICWGSRTLLLYCSIGIFQIFGQDGTTEVGKISKQWSGMLREMFTDADNFGVSCKGVTLIVSCTYINQCIKRKKKIEAKFHECKQFCCLHQASLRHKIALTLPGISFSNRQNKTWLCLKYSKKKRVIRPKIAMLGKNMIF